MSEGGYKRGQLVVVADWSGVSSVIIKHGTGQADTPKILGPAKIHYSEDYKLPIKQFLREWSKHVSAIRVFGGYRYHRVRIDIKMKKERKGKYVPRFLQRQRGEEIDTMPFHLDEWGDAYFPQRINSIF